MKVDPTAGAVFIHLIAIFFEECVYFVVACKFASVNGLQLDAGLWLVQATANTDQALAIISANTRLNPAEATKVFQQFFLHGYADAMWLLVFLPLLPLIFLMVNLNKKELAIDKQKNPSVTGMH